MNGEQAYRFALANAPRNSQPYVTRRLGEVVDDEKVDLKLDEIEKIAAALGVPVQKLISDTTPASAA